MMTGSFRFKPGATNPCAEFCKAAFVCVTDPSDEIGNVKSFDRVEYLRAVLSSKLATRMIVGQ